MDDLTMKLVKITDLFYILPLLLHQEELLFLSFLSIEDSFSLI